MAARRLLIVLIVLLAVSTVAALLAPTEEEPEPPPPTRTTKPPEQRGSKAPGTLVRARLAADARRPQRISLRLGDQLALTVHALRFDQVEIPAFGLLEDVAGDDPARFDLVADREGSFPVRLVEARRTIGQIVVRPPRDRGGISREAPRASDRGRGRDRRGSPER